MACQGAMKRACGGRGGSGFIRRPPAPPLYSGIMSDDRASAPHLLAIDDDETNLALLRAVLSAYRLTTFPRPQQALQALRDGLRPDLIVCDVTMPGMTGFELHAELRCLPALRSVPFVYLTALDGRDDRRHGMGLGADDYVTKPYTPTELRAAVETRLLRAAGIRGAAATDWDIVSLGGLDVHVGDERLHWESRRTAELLLLLLSAGSAEGVSARDVRSELWSSPPDGNQLHALVSRLRKALGERGSVETEQEHLRLTGLGRVRWDVPTFERAASEALESSQAAAVEGALALYRGSFLPDSDCPWVERVRGRLDDVAASLHEAAIERSDGALRERAVQRFEDFLG